MILLRNKKLRDIAESMGGPERIALENLLGAVAVIQSAKREGYLTNDLFLTHDGQAIRADSKGRVKGFQAGTVTGPQCLIDEVRFFRSEAALKCIAALGIRDTDTDDILRKLSSQNTTDKRRKGKGEIDVVISEWARKKLNELPNSVMKVYGEILAAIQVSPEVSVARLQSKTHLGRRTVLRACEDLEKVGLIHRERQSGLSARISVV